ncbi:hypothetical protein [Micromonospora sp. NPDC048830]|uniref:hypothetical protein n=1 Tax=Micromonospora sp. NPDC048830 TaxID=3364257 RepID=UPI0037166AA3
MTALTTTPTTRSAARSTSAPGWRLGALYGPAVYGVSAAAVALPDAARHLHAGGPVLAWILTAYAAGVGVGAVTAGRLIDLWGSRRDRPGLRIERGVAQRGRRGRDRRGARLVWVTVGAWPGWRRPRRA